MMIPKRERRLRFALWLCLAAGSIAGSIHALAQEAPSVGEDPAAAETQTEAGAGATPAPARDAPYEDRLVRLAEIVGSVHYLDTLCSTRAAATGGPETENGTSEQRNAAPPPPPDTPATDWRRMMGALIETEAPEPERNAKLTAAFNRGYRSFASVYTRCTDAARSAMQRYRSEGATLATEIIARFGN